jgi:hypothetical protein
MVKNEIGALIGEVFAKGYIDDRDKLHYMPDAVVIHVKHLNFKEAEVCPHFNKSYYINKLYFGDDGEIHLDKSSSGGIVLDGDIEAYNKAYNIHSQRSKKEHSDAILYLIDKEDFARCYGLPGMVGYAFTW